MEIVEWVDYDGNIDIHSDEAKEMVGMYLHNLTVEGGCEFRNDILEAVSKMLMAESGNL